MRIARTRIDRVAAVPAAHDMPDWEGTWPARIRRRPHRSDGNYLLLSALVDSLVAARDRYVPQGSSMLDVGCGDKPYYPLFATATSEYIGADVVDGPKVDVVCPLEHLAFPDTHFDTVLCSQVLEHVREPVTALREIARVLRPSGVLLASTHGTYPYHPHPTDYWRWTQDGLRALFDDAGGFEIVDLVPHRGSIACLALLVANYVEMATTSVGLSWAGRPVVGAVNTIGAAADRSVARLRYPAPHTLVANFLVVARRN
jgi:SAM-dependent methyltransferase